MAKRKNSSIYDEFYTRVDNKWTCKHCTRFSKTIDTVKNGTNSLKTHLETHHQKQLKDYQEKSKSNVPPPPTKKPKMAEKAPATSAEVERLFSLAGNIVTDLRKRLAAEKVEKILFLNANLPLLDD